MSAILLLFISLSSPGQGTPQNPLRDGGGTSTSAGLRLIPSPRKVFMLNGHFVFSPKVKIFLSDPKDGEDSFSAAELSDEIRTSLGFSPAVTKSPAGKNVIVGRLQTNKVIPKHLKAFGITVPDSLGNEGYILHVAPGEILVAANTGAGVFYGVQTLKQLVRSNRMVDSLPCLTIIDWPALRYRGWMNDISRGPIPTVDFLKNVIRKMAEVKQNYFTLYTEHVFKLKKYPDIAPADGITAQEVGELQEFARKYHIELVGNKQSFGHMEHTLKIPFYRKMDENGWVVAPSEEETYRFLEDNYAEIAPAYASKLFNINCDEAYGIGEGKSKAMVDSMGLDGVYAYHINRIDRMLKQYGKRIMMWGDIAVNNQNIIGKLPKDLIVLSWGYDAAESFDDAITPFTKLGLDFMVAPGVSCWGEVWPNMSNAVINISNYVRDGAKLGAMGVMNTAWDDDGENFFNYNWHGLLWGAECSWNPAFPLVGAEANADREARLASFDRSFDAVFYGTTESPVAQTLFRFDSLRTYPVDGIVYDGAVWSDLLDIHPENTDSNAFRANQNIVRDASSLLNDLVTMKKSVKRNAETIDYAMFAAKRVAFTGRKNLARIQLAGAMKSSNPRDLEEVRKTFDILLEELHQLKNEYVGLWQRENRGWWLDRILDKYDGFGKRVLDLENIVFINPSDKIVDGKRSIELRTIFHDKPIYYSIDGSEPGIRSNKYTAPFELSTTSLIRARVIDNKKPMKLEELFVMVHKGVGKLRKLNSRYSRYSAAYAAGGDNGLVDGLKGSDNFADGRWQGFQGQDLDIELDLSAPTEIRRITMAFLQQSYSWVLMPERVQVWTSGNGENYTLAKEVLNTIDPREEGTIIHDFVAEFKDVKTRYLKIVAKNPGKLPEWHHAKGNESFIFSDEVVVE